MQRDNEQGSSGGTLRNGTMVRKTRTKARESSRCQPKNYGIYLMLALESNWLMIFEVGNEITDTFFWKHCEIKWNLSDIGKAGVLQI